MDKMDVEDNIENTENIEDIINAGSIGNMAGGENTEEARNTGIDHICEENHSVHRSHTMKLIMVNGSVKEINSFFNNLPIRIVNTHENPFFYADDIGKILNIKCIRKSIADFDETEVVSAEQRKKYNINTYKRYKDTFRRNNKIILLTEFGVYRLLMNSRTNVAKEFKRFIMDVLYQIRMTGQYKIEAELQELRTVNETLLIENNRLKEYYDGMSKKQEDFKTMCERIYLIEFENDYLEMETTKLPKKYVKKRSRNVSKGENSIDSIYIYARQLDQELGLNTPFVESDMYGNSDDWRRAYEINKELAIDVVNKHAPKFIYMLTNKVSPDLLTNGTVVNSIWVKDSQAALKAVNRKLSSYRTLNAKDRYYIYTCNKEDIIKNINSMLVE